MPKLRFILRGLVCFGLILALAACGRRESADNAPEAQSTTRLEVVVFSTPTATILAPTKTPLPTPRPIQPTATPTPAVAPATPTPGLSRAENENPLTGLIVADPAILKRRPLHVRIGNDPQARPQVNLSQADLVYEDLVEWWITRLTAIYYGQAPEVVGPERSARLINGQLTQQYQAALVNSGGSDGVRWELSQLPIVNLDEYFHPQPYFYREGEPWQRRLVVNIAEAYTYMKAKELNAAVPLRGFMFDPTPVNGNPAESIYIDYPAKDSKVLWRFNADTGEYERYVAGEPFIDAATNKVISVPNVIIYFAEHSETDIVEDSTGATSVRTT